jgi:deoxyribose-phosphate aldolase
MLLEYSYYDTVNNDNDVKQILTDVSKFPVDSISILFPYIKLAKSIVPESIKISTPIDYPLGIMDAKTRYESIDIAIKNGAKIIDLVCPVHYLCNRKYDKFREDIKNNLELCRKHNVELRYILEYRIYSYDLLYKIAQILVGYGLDTAYPSTGYLLDDINDNILASVLINKKVTNINMICNGNLWNNNHISLVQKANLYGLRVNSLNALELITKNILKS